MWQMWAMWQKSASPPGFQASQGDTAYALLALLHRHGGISIQLGYERHPRELFRGIMDKAKLPSYSGQGVSYVDMSSRLLTENLTRPKSSTGTH